VLPEVGTGPANEVVPVLQLARRFSGPLPGRLAGHVSLERVILRTGEIFDGDSLILVVYLVDPAVDDLCAVFGLVEVVSSERHVALLFLFAPVGALIPSLSSSDTVGLGFLFLE